jgi:hypothetical protein
MHDRRLPREFDESAPEGSPPRPATRMIAEQVEVTRNDELAGEITSQGCLVDARDVLLARFVQTLRVVRGLPLVIVDAQLEISQQPEGEPWSSYYASRLAWREEALTVRCGVDWSARETSRRRIESPEWVEIIDDRGQIASFGCGLPLHRLAAPARLDTLLSVAGETRQRFQFAIGVDCRYPAQTALALLTAGRPCITNLHSQVAAPSGWLLHVGARNVIVTHVEPLDLPAAGVRLRILETEGHGVRTSVTAFRPFRAARQTDFRGEPIETLPVVEGRAQLEIGAFRWMQIEAEW